MCAAASNGVADLAGSSGLAVRLVRAFRGGMSTSVALQASMPVVAFTPETASSVVVVTADLLSAFALLGAPRRFVLLAAVARG